MKMVVEVVLQGRLSAFHQVFIFESHMLRLSFFIVCDGPHS